MTSDNVVGKVVRIKPNDFSCPIGVSRIKSLIYEDDNDRFELIGEGKVQDGSDEISNESYSLGTFQRIYGMA